MTEQEALNVINRSDPRHEAYYRNDQQIVSEVNKAFEVAHPGGETLGAGEDLRRI